ncbi:REDY-like protein HapK [Sphingomonas sp.]|uniref:REDY-like protein HapK n=1 Tax=Sphingomonas sp. TaxID=28214 RepID=UPI0025DAF902|nr:REDY-like protein HapK [Sphingomonas sp.]
MRIIVLFNLKPGVTAADYEQWAHDSDLPTVRALPSIAGFDVYRSTGLLGGGDPPYAYIEIIDVADMDRFQADVATPEMQAIAAEFGKIADATFVTTEAL